MVNPASPTCVDRCHLRDCHWLILVQDLFIDPDLRGQGHGRRMIQQVADLAKEQDCLRVEWATKFDNPARKLYDELAECSFVEYRLKV